MFQKYDIKLAILLRSIGSPWVDLSHGGNPISEILAVSYPPNSNIPEKYTLGRQIYEVRFRCDYKWKPFKGLNYVRTIAAGTTTKDEYDRQPLDAYQPPLTYMYLDNGSQLLLWPRHFETGSLCIPNKTYTDRDAFSLVVITHPYSFRNFRGIPDNAWIPYGPSKLGGGTGEGAGASGSNW